MTLGQKVRSHQFHSLPSNAIQFWVDDYSLVSSVSPTTSTFKSQVVALNTSSQSKALNLMKVIMDHSSILVCQNYLI